MALERFRSRLSSGFFTVSAQTDSMKEYRMSAMAALRSSPVSRSISTMLCSHSSSSFSSSARRATISLFPSITFMAAQRALIRARSA